MEKNGYVLIGLGLGALIGALLTTTKKGKEINDQLNESMNILKNDVVPVVSQFSGGRENNLIVSDF